MIHFYSYATDEVIERHFTIWGIPQQNGVAESMKCILLEKVRCLLSSAGLAKSFWAEALTYIRHLINRLALSAIGGKTPVEVWSENAAQDYDMLRIFGCLAYYHVKEDKLDPRVKKDVFLGFKRGVKSYKRWDLKDKKIVIRRDVTFDEASIMKPTSTKQIENCM